MKKEQKRIFESGSWNRKEAMGKGKKEIGLQKIGREWRRCKIVCISYKYKCYFINI